MGCLWYWVSQVKATGEERKRENGQAYKRAGVAAEEGREKAGRDHWRELRVGWDAGIAGIAGRPNRAKHQGLPCVWFMHRGSKYLCILHRLRFYTCELPGRYIQGLVRTEMPARVVMIMNCCVRRVDWKLWAISNIHSRSEEQESESACQREGPLQQELITNLRDGRFQGYLPTSSYSRRCSLAQVYDRYPYHCISSFLPAFQGWFLGRPQQPVLMRRRCSGCSSTSHLQLQLQPAVTVTHTTPH